MIQQALAERRKGRRVLQAPCVRCGAVLGAAAVARADAEWSAHVAKLFRDHPGMRFRLVRGVHAVCTACGQSHRYDEKSDAFVAARSEPGGV